MKPGWRSAEADSHIYCERCDRRFYGTSYKARLNRWAQKILDRWNAIWLCPYCRGGK